MIDMGVGQQQKVDRLGVEWQRLELRSRTVLLPWNRPQSTRN